MTGTSVNTFPTGGCLFGFAIEPMFSTKCDWVGWVGKYEDIIKRREGQYRVRLLDNHRGADCACPGVEVLPNGTIVITTHGHWTRGEAPYIVSVRFKLSELDATAGKAQTKGVDPIK